MDRHGKAHFYSGVVPGQAPEVTSPAGMIPFTGSTVHVLLSA
jgi:hypothetical protein